MSIERVLQEKKTQNELDNATKEFLKKELDITTKVGSQRLLVRG